LKTRSLPALARCFPRSFTFYVADPVSSIETRSLPTLTHSYPRRFTFYVADPISSIREQALNIQPASAVDGLRGGERSMPNLQKSS
jgi:hypothetical protein